MNSLSPQINRIIFYIIVITLSISPAFATSDVDQRNYLLIGCMIFGILILPFSKCYLPIIDNYLILIAIISLGFQLFFHLSTLRISTILFTILFISYFMLGMRTFIKSKITYGQLEKLFSYLIISYAVVLLIQQCCILLNLPVFNSVVVVSDKWKLNSLAAEPSHTSRYVGILMYSFLEVQEKRQGHKDRLLSSIRKNKLIWSSFLWIMLTTVSGTAILILFLICTRYITKKNMVIIGTITAIVISVGVTSDFTALRRSSSFVTAVSTGNYKNMTKADHSASVRVVPMLLCMERINIFDLKCWIGNGIGSTGKWMSKFFPGVPKGWSGGGIMNYALEYGLLVASIYLIFSFRCCFDKKNKLATVGLWIMCVVLEGINMQMGWLCILLLFIVKQNILENHTKVLSWNNT